MDSLELINSLCSSQCTNNSSLLINLEGTNSWQGSNQWDKCLPRLINSRQELLEEEIHLPSQVEPQADKKTFQASFRRNRSNKKMKATSNWMTWWTSRLRTFPWATATRINPNKAASRAIHLVTTVIREVVPINTINSSRTTTIKVLKSLKICSVLDQTSLRMETLIKWKLRGIKNFSTNQFMSNQVSLSQHLFNSSFNSQWQPRLCSQSQYFLLQLFSPSQW